MAHIDIHLSAAATGVQQPRTLGELPAHMVIQGGTDDGLAVERRDQVIDQMTGPALFVRPVLVPALGILFRKAAFGNEGFGDLEALAIDQLAQEQVHQVQNAVQGIAQAHFRMAIDSRRQHNRQFLDTEAVQMQDEQALEEERIAARLHHVNEAARYAVEPVQAECAGGIVRQTQEPARQVMAQIGQHLAIQVPITQRVVQHVARADNHIVFWRMLDEIEDVFGRMGEVAIHGDQATVTLRIRPVDALRVGAADAELAGTMHDGEARPRCRQFIEQLSGAVR